jgi:hypothetical protein
MCKICNRLIDDPKDRLLLDYVNVADHPDLKEFVKTFVHRSCFVSWDRKEAFTDAAFELITSSIEHGDMYDSVYAQSKLLIVTRSESIIVTDFSTAFQFGIPKSEIASFCDRVATFLESKVGSFRFNEWEFEYVYGGKVILKEYKMDKVDVELTISANRLLEIVRAIQSVQF